MKKINRIILLSIIILFTMVAIGCTEMGSTVDVGFLDGSYQQYDSVEDYTIVDEGLLSDTVDLHFTSGDTIRLHYVTSIEVVE